MGVLKNVVVTHSLSILAEELVEEGMRFLYSVSGHEASLPHIYVTVKLIL